MANQATTARRHGAEANRRLADEAYAGLYEIVAGLREDGLSLPAIAGRLNSEGLRTRTGSYWSTEAVRRVLARGRRLRGQTGTANEENHNGRSP